MSKIDFRNAYSPTIDMKVGEVYTLILEFTPANATNKNVIWSSDNPNSVTVDSAGNIKAVSIGGARVTCKTVDGNKTADCVIYVSPIPFVHPETYPVTDTLLLISIEYACDSFPIPSYWRLISATKTPPLEIGINTDKKSIKSITLFVDASRFVNLAFPEINASQGSIIIDTTIFNKQNDYIDIVGSYLVSLTDTRFICVFDTTHIVQEIVGSNNVKLFINDRYELCGFAIYDLRESELKTIKSVISTTTR